MKVLTLLSTLIFFAVNLSPAEANEPTLTLKKAIEIMELQHPEIAIKRARVEETHAMRKSAPSLPPPTLTFGVMGVNAPFDSNMKMENSFSISQTIPFPTKLTSESNLRKFESLQAESELDAERFTLQSQLKAAYFELYGARKKQELYLQKQDVLTEHSKRLRAITLTDRIVQSHRVWIQTELELIKNSLIQAKEEERIAAGKLNVALGIDPFTSVPKLEEPGITPLPSSSEKIQTTNPDLQVAWASKNAAESSLSQSRSLWFPDLSISYRSARRFDGLMANYSEVMVGVTLPFLYFWESQGQTSAAHARVRQAEAKIEKTKNELNFQLLEARAKTESLREQVANYEERILPQSEKRMKISHGLVPSDMESLDEHRNAMESVVDLKIAALNTRINYENSVAELERLLASRSSSQREQKEVK